MSSEERRSWERLTTASLALDSSCPMRDLMTLRLLKRKCEFRLARMARFSDSLLTAARRFFSALSAAWVRSASVAMMRRQVMLKTMMKTVNSP